VHRLIHAIEYHQAISRGKIKHAGNAEISMSFTPKGRVLEGSPRRGQAALWSGRGILVLSLHSLLIVVRLKG
jgi:hypothetical protein